MSNITPIRQPMPAWGGPPGVWPPHGGPPDGWWWDGTNWQCGTPCPPPPCPPPQCAPAPQPPSCFSAVAKAQSCYDQSQALYNLVSQVVSDIFMKNPGIIPSPPPGVGSGPILGVTDGSNAAPGEVGEFIQLTGQLAYAAYPTNTTGVISLGVIPPGDWDFDVSVYYSSFIGGTNFILSPGPAGISNGMAGISAELSFTTPGTFENVLVIGQAARGSFAVPSLMAFGIQVNQGQASGLAAGTATMYLEARRAR